MSGAIWKSWVQVVVWRPLPVASLISPVRAVDVRRERVEQRALADPGGAGEGGDLSFKVVAQAFQSFAGLGAGVEDRVASHFEALG